MLELQDVFSRFAGGFLESHCVHSEGLNAINAIINCRTPSLGGHVDVCDSCGSARVSYNSCRNRNCPKCGNLNKEQWVLDRSSELLPVPYFHTVFTVPHQLNSLFLSNQDLLYSLLFKAASQTLTCLALKKKYLGAQIGVTMVLHTWGQNLSFHPHVHCIVPGGGLSLSNCSFVRSKKKFFIPVKVLSKVFRGKFLFFLKKAFEVNTLRFSGESLQYAEKSSFQSLIDSLFDTSWVVYCKKPFKESYRVVEYLSRYTHKTAIYNNRLVSLDDSSVTFRYRDYKDRNKVKLMSLETMEFIRRFLLHVLPSGFQKIRYYGFLSNRNRKSKLLKCFLLTRTPIKPKMKLSARELILKVSGVDFSICPHCGGNWTLALTLLPTAG